MKKIITITLTIFLLFLTSCALLNDTDEENSIMLWGTIRVLQPEIKTKIDPGKDEIWIQPYLEADFIGPYEVYACFKGINNECIASSEKLSADSEKDGYYQSIGFTVPMDKYDQIARPLEINLQAEQITNGQGTIIKSFFYFTGDNFGDDDYLRLIYYVD